MKDNKMIAEFMQLPTEIFQPRGIINYGIDDSWYEEHELSYHLSWDWLMPVVEKIESLGYSYDRINADVFINTQEGKNIIPNPMDGSTMTMLQKTYRAVVEFINQYIK